MSKTTSLFATDDALFVLVEVFPGYWGSGGKPATTGDSHLIDGRLTPILLLMVLVRKRNNNAC